MTPSTSKNCLLAGMSLLVLAGCSPQQPAAPVDSTTQTARTARVPVTAKNNPPKKPAKTYRATTPAQYAASNLNPAPADDSSPVVTPAPVQPRSVLAAMSVIRRATTDAERRRAVAAFVSNARFMSSSPASVEMLLDALKIAPEHDVMMAVQQVLGQSPDTGVPFVAALLYQDATTAAERERLLGVIRHTQTPAAVTMLTGLADAATGQYADPLALAAIDTLGVIGTPAAVRDLTARIESGSAQGQNVQLLVEALSRTINPAAFDLLATAARGENNASTPLRLAALNALGNYPTPASRDALTRIVAIEADANMLAAAKQALKRANLDLPADFGTPPAP